MLGHAQLVVDHLDELSPELLGALMDGLNRPGVTKA
jgi:hypothetical protein